MTDLYKVYWEYHYLKTEGLVKVYFLNGVPFTWDEVESDIDTGELSAIINKARKRYLFTPEDIYMGSSYLLEEGLHPLLDSIDLDEASQLPK